MAMFESRLLSKCSPDFLAAGESAVSVARAFLSCGPPTIARAEVELVAPVTRMDKVMVVMMMGIMMMGIMMMMMAGDLYRDELQGPLLRAEHARAHRAARLQQGISYFYKQTSDKSQKMRLSRGTEIIIFGCKSTTPVPLLRGGPHC